MDWRRRTVRQSVESTFCGQVRLGEEALDYEAVVVASGTLGGKQMELKGLQEALRSGKVGTSGAD